MNLVDDELQDKIDKLDLIRQGIGTNLFGALTDVSKLEEVFPISDNGNKRAGEQNTQSKPEIQEEQTSPDSET